MSKKRRNRRSFTLLELLVVLMLFAMAASVVSWGGWRLYQTFRFHERCQAVLERLTSFQLLALTYRTELQLEFYCDSEGFGLAHVSDKPLPLLASYELAATGAVERLVHEGREVERLTVTFFPDGRFEPRTLVTLMKRDEEFTIDLSRPLQIKGKPNDENHQ